MKQTLIKLSDTHYIVVDDSEIKEGDWLYSFDYGLIVQANRGSADTINSKSLNGRGYGKITHSTQPESLGMGWMQSVLPLLLSEVKELIGEVDVEKKAINSWEGCDGCDANDELFFINGYQKGYNQAIEEYTKSIHEILDHLIDKMDSISQEMIDKDPLQLGRYRTFKYVFDYIKSSTQPKTEWEVEIVDGKLKLK